MILISWILNGRGLKRTFITNPCVQALILYKLRHVNLIFTKFLVFPYIPRYNRRFSSPALLQKKPYVVIAYPRLLIPT